MADQSRAWTPSSERIPDPPRASDRPRQGRPEVYQVVLGAKATSLSSCLLRGTPESVSVELTYSIWVVIGSERVTLIDTGPSLEAAARRGIAVQQTRTSALHALGVGVGDVTDIVLTHVHFDHAGGLTDFPHARIHVQQQDLEFYTGPFMRFPLCSSAVEPADLAALAAAREEGRLVVLSGDQDFGDGVESYLVGGHTPGTQIVRVRGAHRTIVLASDAAHLYANLERGVPFPVLHDVPHSCAAIERLTLLAEDDAVVVPGHDGAVMGQFEAVDGAAGRFARRLA